MLIYSLIYFVQALKAQLGANVKGQLIARQCDVSVNADVVKTFDWIEQEYAGGVNVLINNAGISRYMWLSFFE